MLLGGIKVSLLSFPSLLSLPSPGVFPLSLSRPVPSRSRLATAQQVPFHRNTKESPSLPGTRYASLSHTDAGNAVTLSPSPYLSFPIPSYTGVREVKCTVHILTHPVLSYPTYRTLLILESNSFYLPTCPILSHPTVKYPSSCVALSNLHRSVNTSKATNNTSPTQSHIHHPRP